MVKKILKITGRVLLVIVLLIVLLTVGLFISDRVQHKSEKKLLIDEGYLNLVDAGDYRLNVCSYGSDSPKHTIVGISGMGVSNYSVAMRAVTDRFADENKIVFIDRAGYGLSDDTKIPQTTERIVEDYRTALKNAGFEAPYVIVPHSLGGIYTSYWVSKYPDEIEGIVYLDTTQCMDNETTFEDMKAGFVEHMFAIACKLGYQRPLWHIVDPTSYGDVPEELNDINEALMFYHGYTNAMISETKYVNENCYTSYKNTVSTDVPKVYISSNNSAFTPEDFYEMLDAMNKVSERTGAKKFDYPTEDQMETILKQIDEFRNTVVIPYAESLGNCEIKYVNGSHMVYTHKPDETADIIEEFLEKLDK